jgi:hypothetical protein
LFTIICLFKKKYYYSPVLLVGPDITSQFNFGDFQLAHWSSPLIGLTSSVLTFTIGKDSPITVMFRRARFLWSQVLAAYHAGITIRLSLASKFSPCCWENGVVLMPLVNTSGSESLLESGDWHACHKKEQMEKNVGSRLSMLHLRAGH